MLTDDADDKYNTRPELFYAVHVVLFIIKLNSDSFQGFGQRLSLGAVMKRSDKAPCLREWGASQRLHPFHAVDPAPRGQFVHIDHIVCISRSLDDSMMLQVRASATLKCGVAIQHDPSPKGQHFSACRRWWTRIVLVLMSSALVYLGSNRNDWQNRLLTTFDHGR